MKMETEMEMLAPRENTGQVENRIIGFSWQGLGLFEAGAEPLGIV
jgi:hypothetical protein